MTETPLAGNLLVVLIGVLSIVPLIAIIVFLAIRMRRGSDRPARDDEKPPKEHN